MLDGDDAAIVSESLWHDELFFSGPFRNDSSTDWRWRIDEDWSHSIRFNDLVNHCYHRFNFQYFHWMMDCLPRVWMLQKYANHGRAKWLVGPLDKAFHLPSLELLGIGLDDCVLVPHGSIAQFEKLVIPAFIFQEPLNTLRPNYDSGNHHIGWSAEYVDDIRRLAWDRYGNDGERDLRIFVSRDDASHRNLRNETEVTRLLIQNGFVTVQPGTLSFAQQVSLFSRARIIVGLHGAGLTNLMWAHPSTEILELASADLNDSGYRFLANLCGHKHSVIECRAFSHPEGAAYADIEVNLQALRAALDYLLMGNSSKAGVLNADTDVLLDYFQNVEQEAHSSWRPAQESYDRRDFPQALRQILMYCSRNASSGWGWLLCGRVYRAMGDYKAMKSALDRTLSLPDIDPHVGAAYEILEVAIAREDFTDKDLIDFALFQAEGSEQERWYRGKLLFVKALAYLHDGTLVEADRTLQRAYAYRTDTNESEFLFPWVLAKLSNRESLQAYPYLDYLAQRAAMIGNEIDYQSSLDAMTDDAFVVEIGAMDGVRFDTLHQSLVSRNWRAILVEPTQRMFNQLVHNFSISPNARCVRVAISDRSGPMQIHRIDPGLVAAGEVEEWALGLSALSRDRTLKFYDGRLETEEVEALTLADFLLREDVPRIDILQIDTEGHDFVIFDQIDFDKYPIRLLHIELVNLDPLDRVKIFERLRLLGYKYYYDGIDLTALAPG